MSKKKIDLLQGTLDLLVLKALALGPLHGLGVSGRIEQITNGTFIVKPGSLFHPVQGREERAGFDYESPLRKLFDAARDAQPVQRPEGQRLQHEQVERPL